MARARWHFRVEDSQLPEDIETCRGQSSHEQNYERGTTTFTSELSERKRRRTYVLGALGGIFLVHQLDYSVFV